MKEPTFVILLGCFVLSLSSIVSVQSLTSPYAQDDTLTPLARGRDVVFATVNKIQSALIFTEDFDFLKRVAFIESELGEASFTFPSDFFGGIWQVKETQFEAARNSTQLSSLYAKISTQFQIDWPSTTWNDLLKPLYSAIAARLFLYTLSVPIPQTIQTQATYWKQYYNPQSNLTAANFVENVTKWEEQAICDGKLDLLVILDESGSVASTDFTSSLSFVADLFDSYSLENVRQGFMTFSTTTKIVFPIDNDFTAPEIKQKVLAVRQDSGGTETNVAIARAISLFASTEERLGVPKILTIFTDGGSNSGVSNAALLKGANITSFAIGIGANPNQNELEQIASGDLTHVFSLTDFDALREFFRRLNSETCDIPQKPGLNETIEEEIGEKEKRIYNFDLPATGLNVYLNVLEGAVESFFSYSYDDPSSAFNDGVVPSHNQRLYIYPNSAPSIWISVIGLTKNNTYTLVAVSSLFIPTTERPPTPPWQEVGPCFQLGLFPDQEDCSKYHECAPNEVGDYWDVVYSCNEPFVWCQDTLSCASKNVCPCTL